MNNNNNNGNNNTANLTREIQRLTTLLGMTLQFVLNQQMSLNATQFHLGVHEKVLVWYGNAIRSLQSNLVAAPCGHYYIRGCLCGHGQDQAQQPQPPVPPPTNPQNHHPPQVGRLPNGAGMQPGLPPQIWRPF